MKILLITSTLPWPLQKTGNSQRSGLLLRALQNWGDVDVLVASGKGYFSRPDVIENMDRSTGYAIRKFELDLTQEAGPWRQLAVLTRGKLKNLFRDLARCKADFTPDKAALESMRKVIQDAGYDIVVSRSLVTATRTGAAFLSTPCVLLDFDDIDWAVHGSSKEVVHQSATKRLRAGIFERYIERRARKCLRNFAHVWGASAEDRTELALPRCSVLPNVPILPFTNEIDSSKNAPEPKTILFVGLLLYGPNFSGLDHFLGKIWPAVHQAHPEVRLQIVGKLLEDSQLVDVWKKMPNVELFGFIEDLDEAYARAVFTIAPVYWGGGTKIKVLESLGRGRTCVAAAHALYGISQHVRHDDSVWCADTDEDFVQGCIALLENPELRQRLETRGIEVIREHFSVARFNQAVDDVMREFQGHSRNGQGTG